MNASRPRLRTRGFWPGLLFLAVAASLTLAGCAAREPAVSIELPPTPAWLATADKAIQADYTWAAAHHDELQHIPCYCGCGNIGHTSNSTCYFTRDAAGTITGYEQHAVG